MSVLVTSAETLTGAAVCVWPVTHDEGVPELPCVPSSAFVEARLTSM